MSTKLFVRSLAVGFTVNTLAGLSNGLAAEFTGKAVGVIDRIEFISSEIHGMYSVLVLVSLLPVASLVPHLVT